MVSSRGVVDFDEVQRQSAPGAVFDSRSNIGWKPKDLLHPLLVEEQQAKQSNHTILIKREGTGSFCDSFMEIMSMTLSIDILRMSSDIRLGDSFINHSTSRPAEDTSNHSRRLARSPLYDLLSFFAGSTSIRFKDILDGKIRAEALISAHTSIVPLPGSSNPLSQINQRVLRNYGVLCPLDGNGISKVVMITLLAGRRIRETDHLLHALHRAFPNVIALELRIVQSTHVLVGAHGDGLSHIMFMRACEGAVVEIQPAGLSATNRQARYKSLAMMIGREYFMAEAEAIPLGQG
ncbi:hypothetical protein INS49_012657 [Diaporthe citri]|uniref:uncharacterized protein n=1 Tax=Diaporthe citri TaxID=83186 RepID=UPI001C7FB1DD|nr:uncharacterized protein INS49_012657 [Diaporthe citri]KAG6359137.1 hypothetical protein INS49_012657 [Diaporthe citri]